LGSVTVIAMPARLFVAGARRGAAGVVVAGGVVAGGVVAGGVVAGGVVAGGVVAGGVVAGGVVAGAVGLGAGAGVVAGGAGFGWLVPSCGLAGVGWRLRMDRDDAHDDEAGQQDFPHMHIIHRSWQV
jgi:hypothetical protein